MCSPDKVKCFNCFKWFDKEKQEVKQCKECGDFKCPQCNACMCNLNDKEKKIVLAMINTYENHINSNYDFSVHKKVEEKIKY